MHNIDFYIIFSCFNHKVKVTVCHTRIRQTVINLSLSVVVINDCGMYQQNAYNQGMNAQYPNNQPQYYGHQQPQQYGGLQEPTPSDYTGFSVGQQPQQDTRVETVSSSISHQTEAIKEIERSAMFTFCPCGPYLAAGSVAGAIDLSFSTSSQLEVRS